MTRTRAPGRRRRDNPLRRRSDVMEAWALVVVAVLLFLAAPLAGVVAGWWAHDDARATAAAQRADRHRIRAQVTGAAASGSLPTVQSTERKQRVTVRWTDPDGTRRTDTALVPAGALRGERVDVWLDSAGRSVSPPTTGATIWQHTVTIGVCATAGTAGLVLLGHALFRRVTTAHRLTEWEREWARVEPQWSRRDA
ncbi:Rv1733c family protein [Streptomyces sp. NPDC002776]